MSSISELQKSGAMEPIGITLFKTLCVASILCIFETYFFFNISKKDALMSLELTIKKAAKQIESKLNLSQMDGEAQNTLNRVIEQYKQLEKREISRRIENNKKSYVNAILIASLLITATISTGYVNNEKLAMFGSEIGILMVLTVLSIVIFQYFFYINIGKKYQYVSEKEIIYNIQQYIIAQEKLFTQQNK